MRASPTFTEGRQRMKRHHARQALCLLSIGLALTGCYLTFLSMGLYRDYVRIPRELVIGNRGEGLKALKERGLPFAFFVMGDTQLSGIAKRMLRDAAEKEKPSFAIIVGDFVKEPDLWRHRFFLKEMAVELSPPFPVFLVPGNHDIDYGSKIRDLSRRVTPEVYEGLYGRRSLDFIFNDCLFILCGVDLKKPDEYLRYLRETLSLKGGGRKAIFVFVHYPPRGLSSFIHGPLPKEEVFYSLLETYRVTACFFGDYHGYWRGQRKGVTLIVSGGGGRFKGYQPEWGKFHHILKVTVEKDQLSEEIMVFPDRIPLKDSIEEMVFVKLLPIVENRGWVLYGLLGLFLSWSGASVIIWVRGFRKRGRKW